MNKIITLAIASVFVFGTTACGSDSDNPESPVTVTVSPDADSNGFEFSDEQFADLIRENTDAFDGATDEEIVEVAEGFCDMWDAGADFNDFLDVVIDSGTDPTDAGFLVGAGTQAYCPEYVDELPMDGTSV